ncbi:sialoadhesin-like [Scyliorhinus torazame]|uniref:sialoadhesin-like n=1 Tax=Scyliorhinus torazame TaxID=75743 RepID=UPI003B5B8C41
MIGKSYFLLSLLQVGLSQEWKGDTPRNVTAQEGSCVKIPCHYSYPSYLANRPRGAVWFNTEEVIPWAPLAFHSKDHNYESPRFRHRTRLSGDLKDGDCSLIINNITREDAGPYFFRIEFDSGPSHNYYPATRLNVSDFTDKPTISPAEIIVGKRVDISCTFNTTCNGTAPVLTWDTPTDVPGSVSNTVTQHGVTLTYTSVLTLTPSLKHHGQNLTCRVRYPSVSSERTLVLSVQYKPEISQESGCTRRSEGLTCNCVANSNPPGDLTWHLPHANISGNQTQGRLVSWYRDGHLVIGSLILTVPQDEEEVMASCSVRNPHGEAIFKVYLWVEDRDSSEWTVGLLIAGIILCTFVAGILIFMYVKKRKAATEERDSETSDIALSPSPLTVKNQNMLHTKPRNTNRDTTRKAEGSAPPVQCGKVWEDAGHENPSKPDNLLYANINIAKLRSGDGTVSREEETEYAQITFQRNFGLPQEWKGQTPGEVTAQEGSCVQIPCRYSYPSHLANQPRGGVWFNNKKWETSSIVFHSKDHNHALPRFRSRTRLSGDLKDGDCSLIINDITREDAGPYYFRIEFNSQDSFSYLPVTQLHISDFTDKPRIFPTEIIAGKRVDISCTFNTTCSGTAPGLTWDTPTDVPGSVSNTVTQHGVTLTYTSVLSLTPSLKHHGQTLTCRVRYPSASSERTLVLTVQYAPRNLSMNSLDMINASSINTIEGNSTVIICSVKSFPASNLTWRHLNVTMNRTSSNNELWLVIPHVTSRDAGDYECVAENEHGEVEGFIAITVEHKPRNLSMTSLDMINSSSINIIEGNSTVIICSVESFPASNLTWRHINVPMNRTSSNNELWLVIPHVTSRDTGDYECVAENEHGAVEKSITITVEHAPRNISITSLDMINASLINIIEGNSTVIICSVESFPASNLTWRHLNVPMNRTSSNNELWLVIPHVTSRDTGDYECVAENEHGAVEGSITITVEHAPRSLSMTSLEMMNTPLINVIEGNSTVIICSVESFPASNLTWRHLNVPMNRTSSSNELWLVIPHVTSRDTGDYECAAENEHGAVEGSITITVEHAPRNLSMTSFDMINTSLINVIEGNSAEIICSVESFPASNLMWRHLNVPMNRTSSNNELWLVIPHITSRDTGDYECVAENEYGSVEGSITITVEYVPRNLSMTSLDMINTSLINIIEGNSTVIICSVESFPASNLTWRHLNVPMNRTSSSNELWLVIPHVTSRDTGDYVCVAENEHGAVEGSITITVEHAPRNLSMTSFDMINTSLINAVEGNSAEIICSVESFPASNLMWRHLNIPMNRTSSNNELWMVIPHVTSRDTGDYVCVAENEHGVVEGSLTITVECECTQISTSVRHINSDIP